MLVMWRWCCMQIGEIANVDGCSQAMEDVLNWTT